MEDSGDLILGERLADQISNVPPGLSALLREELPYLATSGFEDLLVLYAVGGVDPTLADHHFYLRHVDDEEKLYLGQIRGILD